MRRLLLLLWILSVMTAAAAMGESPARPSPIVLAGDHVRFDVAMHPWFTERQIRNSFAATREGLALWAATESGRETIARLSSDQYEVDVIEDGEQTVPGRAPQPSLPTLLASFDSARHKSYAVLLNPAFFHLPEGMEPDHNGPASAAQMMAVAWAAEMLHVSFYAQGISLPHHSRSDFQEAWRRAASELGFPTMVHDDEEPSQRALRGVW